MEPPAHGNSAPNMEQSPHSTSPPPSQNAAVQPPSLTRHDRFNSSATNLSDHTLKADTPTPNPESSFPSNLPPQLPYSLHTRKRGIAIGFTSILLGACIIPVVLYFTLTRLTDLELDVVFAIITSVPAVQLLEWAQRTYQLLRPSDTYRPLNSPRWGLDFFHWNYCLGVICITTLLSVGSGIENIILISLPLPYLLITVGTLTVITQGILIPLNVRTPVRLSSVPAGSLLRPATYFLVEDVVAVNGVGGKEFRAAWMARYEASAPMRRLLGRLSWFWGVPAMLLGVLLAVLVGTVDREIAYALCWTLPWAWAGVWAYLTIRWVQGALVEERAAFKVGEV